MARYNSGVGTGEGDDAVISFVFDEHENVAEWVKARLPMIRNGFGPCAAIGIIRNGLAIAGVVYHEYRGWDMQLSMAADSPYWCSRRTLNILLGYPFNQLHVARITACTAKGNKRLRSLVERLGFVLEGTHPRGFDGRETLLTYGLQREQAYKWIAHEKLRLAA